MPDINKEKGDFRQLTKALSTAPDTTKPKITGIFVQRPGGRVTLNWRFPITVPKSIVKSIITESVPSSRLLRADLRFHILIGAWPLAIPLQASSISHARWGLDVHTAEDLLHGSLNPVREGQQARFSKARQWRKNQVLTSCRWQSQCLRQPWCWLGFFHTQLLPQGHC